jgi:hypothetical protein
MRKRFIQNPNPPYDLIPADEYASAPGPRVYVMGDIAPYRSMVTGEEIASRSTHRAHLRQHGLVEVGNETKYLKPKPMTPPPGLKKTLIEVANSKL